MKLSPCSLSLFAAVLLVVAQHHLPCALAFMGPERHPKPASFPPARKSSVQSTVSASTVNILGDDEEEDAASSISPPATMGIQDYSGQSSKGPLSAAAASISTTSLSPPATSTSSSSSSSSSCSEDVVAVGGGVVVDWDWEGLATKVFSEGDVRPIVLFDGVCNLCHGGVNFAMDHDETAQLRFCSLQSKTAQSLLIQAGQRPTDTNKIVLVTKDQTYFSSDAVTRICQQLDAAPLLQWIGTIGRITPPWMREPLFQWISRHRHHFGETDSCRLDLDGTWASRFVSDPIEWAEV